MRFYLLVFVTTVFLSLSFDAVYGQCAKPTLTVGLQYVSTEPTTIGDGVTVTFGCMTGYTLSGTAAVTCTTTTLSKMPTCTPVCTKPTLTDGLQYVGTEPGTIFDGDTFNFECMTGYTLSGTAAVTCTTNTLSTMPTCTPDDCTDPGAAPTNGQKTGSTYTHGSSVTYSCDSGYNLSGPGVLTCSAGSWDNPLPTCGGESGAGFASCTLSLLSTLLVITLAFYKM